MSFSKIMIAACLVATATAPAAANRAEANTSVPAETTASDSAQEKKICRRLATTGTRMERRTCLTKEQWKKVQQQLD